MLVLVDAAAADDLVGPIFIRKRTFAAKIARFEPDFAANVRFQMEDGMASEYFPDKEEPTSRLWYLLLKNYGTPYFKIMVIYTYILWYIVERPRYRDWTGQLRCFWP
jgi:hypothetical protein